MRWVPIIAGTCLLLLGCSGPRRVHKHPLFVTESDAARYLSRALESDSADQRREAIVRLAKTRYAGRDVVVRGMILVAKGDTSVCVRSAAIRALEKTGDPRITETMLAILAPAEQRDPKIVAPDDSVRWDAIRAVGMSLESGADTTEHRDAIATTAIRLLRTDASRDVRVTSAAVLGYVPTRDVADALVQGLTQRDFGVVYTCERSLMRLTGHTHEHDDAVWKAWLRESTDPFADAGRLDDRLNRDEKNWFRRTWDSTCRTLASYRPKDST